MKKILIVEDDENIARVYKIKLAKEGYEVDHAVDGQEGFDKIVAGKPDLVLLDLMLPVRDGFWVLEEMKKRPELKKTMVVVLSNLSQQADKDFAKKLGADDYYVKADISINELVTKIKKYLTTPKK